MSTCIKELIQNMNLVVGCNVGCSYCYARNNTRRFHIIDDFEKPVFFDSKLKMIDRKKPHNYLLTGMSDLSIWTDEWLNAVFNKMKENLQHQFVFLTKRPDLLSVETAPDNAWFGVTVTCKSDLWRIDTLRKNVKAKHLHVTFEPLFDDPGEVDFTGIDWIVIGTMTGAKSKKIKTNPDWAKSLSEQAHELSIPVFMKEDLIPIMGEENMIQELPHDFNKVLKEQRAWNNRK